MNAMKIYSLNLMAYIQMQTGEKPKMHYEYDEKLGCKWYGVYSRTDDVLEAMGKEPIILDLHEFLDTLSDIRNRKNEIRESVQRWNQ